MPLMDLKVDFAFKQLFGKSGNEPILIEFLNAVLKRPVGRQITSIEFQNTELGPRYMEDKKSIMDIHARSADGLRINIEIQLDNRYDMEKRTLYYWSCIFSEQMQKGMAYSEMAQTITINILNFRYRKTSNQYHSTFHIYEDSEKALLTDALEIHFMEIPKLMVSWRNRTVSAQEDRLVRWLLLLEAADDAEIRSELEAIAMNDPVMKSAFEKWEDISRDPHALAEYRSRRMAILDEAAAVREAELRKQQAEQEGRQEGHQEGRQEGHQEGHQAAMKYVVKRMLDAHQDIETIASFTGLSRSEVEHIQRNLQ